MAPGHHRPAADENGGQVQPRGGHQHARHDLVAVGDEDQPVEGVAHRHHLHRIGDQFAAGQGESHPGMAHRDPVADADGVEGQRRAARHPHAGLDRLLDAVEVDVTGHDVVVGVDHADQRAVELLRRQARGIKKAPMWSPFESSFRFVAAHFSPCFFQTEVPLIGTAEQFAAT